jgi:hypothetical protein
MGLTTHDREILRRRVHGLVDDAIVAEHRANPFGPHSPGLAEVLDFLRRSPDPDLPRYLVIDVGDGFAVADRAERAGDPPERLAADLFRTRAEAEHAVFLLRLADYGIPTAEVPE